MGNARIAKLALLLGLAVVSCDKYIYDGAGNCDISVRFKYEFNMMYVDAFATDVHSVSLFVFDPTTGALVAKASDSGQHLNEDYYMTIPGLSTGNYDLVAWCGLSESEFTVTDPANIRDLLCRMNTRTKADTYVDMDLGPVYHGILRNVHLEPLPEGGVQVVKIPLRKNTNQIKVVLQALNSAYQVTPSEYEIIIEDNVVELDHENKPTMETPLTYYPWDYNVVTVEAGSTTSLTGVLAEFSTNRLLTKDAREDAGIDKNYKPRLKVIDKTGGSVVIDIPLVDCLLMVKGNYNRDISDQEYLDRQDDYNLIFFLDNTRGWSVSSGIYINGWHVVLNNVVL